MWLGFPYERTTASSAPDETYISAGTSLPGTWLCSCIFSHYQRLIPGAYPETWTGHYSDKKELKRRTEAPQAPKMAPAHSLHALELKTGSETAKKLDRFAWALASDSADQHGSLASALKEPGIIVQPSAPARTKSQEYNVKSGQHISRAQGPPSSGLTVPLYTDSKQQKVWMEKQSLAM